MKGRGIWYFPFSTWFLNNNVQCFFLFSEVDNKFLVFSGGAKKVEAITDLQVYQLDIASKEWTTVPSKGQIPKPRQGHALIAVDDKVLFV